MHFLVVEDDAALADALCLTFRRDGTVVDWASSGTRADRWLEREAFDLVVLDLSLPDLDGLEVLRRLRRRGSGTPVLIVSASQSADEIAAGLDAGADDYLGKPFAANELLARVRALLRRGAALRPTAMPFGQLVYDTALRTASVEGSTLQLSNRETSLLETLLMNIGNVVTKERLMARAFGLEGDANSNTIEVYVHRLRKKIEVGGIRIATVRGLGYCLEKIPG
jgi:two-component system OmpR family response regulator